VAPATAPSPGAAAPSPGGVGGRWQVHNVPNGPWTFEFAVKGVALTGMIQQRSDSATPISISAGKVAGPTLSFKVLSPDGERIIVFNGRINTDEISFVRQIIPIDGGTRGGNDLFGGSAPLQFIATRSR